VLYIQRVQWKELIQVSDLNVQRLELESLSQPSSMSSIILELNCWVLGDDPKRVFPVEIAKKTVNAL